MRRWGPAQIAAPIKASCRRSASRRSAVARARTSPMVTSGGTGRNDDHSSRNHSREARTAASAPCSVSRSEEHTSELQSPCNLVCRLLLEKKKKERSADGVDHAERSYACSDRVEQAPCL